MRIPFKAAPLIELDCLYTLYYFEFACGYLFEGEKHDFWEMVYIDRGEADIGADGVVHRLTQGQVIFHKPGEFHTIWANAEKGTNIFVITFSSRSPAMRVFEGMLCTLDGQERRLISRIVEEGRSAFGPVMDVRDDLVLVPNAPVESTQLIEIHLVELLLLLHRSATPAPTSTVRLTENAFDLTPINALMRSRLDGSLRFEDVCHHTGMGGTALKTSFKEATGMTVMAYYQRLRLEESRRLLRAGGANVGEVAEAMGYSSVQAFSRQFKRLMGVSPLVYLKMVRS